MSAAASPLKKIVEQIRAGKLDAARNQLVELLRSEPSNAQAWYLLSFTLDDPQRRQYALLQAIKAQPDFERAHERLRQLRGELPAPQPSVTPEPARPITPAFAPETDTVEDSLRSEQPVESPKLKRSRLPALLGLMLLAVLALLWLFGGDLFGGGGQVAATATNVPFRTLPAVWTPTGGAITQETPTPQPGPLATLQPEAQALLQTIGEQVSQVRGLSAEQPLHALLLQEDTAAERLEQQLPDRAKTERMLQAIGLLAASANLETYGYNRQLDAYGASFPVANQHTTYLLGTQLSDTLSYAFARVSAFDLLQTRFGPAQNCPLFDDGCRAAMALLQGDANLTGEEWLNTQGAAAFDPASLPPANYARLQSGAASDVAVLDLRFAAETGLSFARTLYSAGGWEQLNAAYSSLPATTEHILHPEKYVANEPALNVQAVDLGSVLGEGWELQGRGQLGEWLTRLVLAAGADSATRIPEESAVVAASGWGGDDLQVYWRNGDGQFALVQHWLADDAANGQELHAGVQQYLSLRFGGAPGELGRGRCWQAGGQASCLLANGAEVVWLLLPDEPELIAAALGLFAHIP